MSMLHMRCIHRLARCNQSLQQDAAAFSSTLGDTWHFSDEVWKGAESSDFSYISQVLQSHILRDIPFAVSFYILPPRSEIITILKKVRLGSLRFGGYYYLQDALDVLEQCLPAPYVKSVGLHEIRGVTVSNSEELVLKLRRLPRLDSLTNDQKTLMSLSRELSCTSRIRHLIVSDISITGENAVEWLLCSPITPMFELITSLMLKSSDEIAQRAANSEKDTKHLEKILMSCSDVTAQRFPSLTQLTVSTYSEVILSRHPVRRTDANTA